MLSLAGGHAGERCKSSEGPSTPPYCPVQKCSWIAGRWALRGGNEMYNDKRKKKHFIPTTQARPTVYTKRFTVCRGFGAETACLWNSPRREMMHTARIIITSARMLVAQRYCILSWLKRILVPNAGIYLSLRKITEYIEANLIPNFCSHDIVG